MNASDYSGVSRVAASRSPGNQFVEQAVRTQPVTPSVTAFLPPRLTES